MKRALIGLILLALMLWPMPAKAQDACNSQACFYSGYYSQWYGPFGFPCHWTYAQYFDGWYNYSDSCGYNYSGWGTYHP
jgi:hypothetical protein